MKKHLLFLCALIGMLWSTALAQCQQLATQTESGKQTVLTRSDIDCLPHVKVTTHGFETSTTFEGVALKTVFRNAGVEFGHCMRETHSASCLLVEAADGCRVVIARDSGLLNHYLSGLNEEKDSVTFFRVQLVSTPPVDSTLDQIVYAHDHVRHDITQLNFFDCSTELISG